MIDVCWARRITREGLQASGSPAGYTSEEGEAAAGVLRGLRGADAPVQELASRAAGELRTFL